MFGAACFVAANAYSAWDLWVNPATPGAGPGHGGLVRNILSYTNGANPTLLMASVYGSGIFKSTDAGTTWTAANTGLTDLRVRTIADSSADASTSVLYAATEGGGGVYKSTDMGATWAPVNNGLNCRIVRTVHVRSATLLYAGTACGAVSGLYRSTDGGANWTQVLGTGLPAVLSVNQISANNAGTVIRVSGGFGVYSSTDSGATWTLRNGSAPTDLGANGTAPVGPNVQTARYNVMVGGTAYDFVLIDGAGLFRAPAGTSTWTQLNSGLPHLRQVGGFSVDAINGTQTFTLALQGSGIYSTTDPAAGWSLLSPDVRFARGVEVDVSNDQTLYLASLAGAYKSTNSGATWTAIKNGLPGGNIAAVATDPTNPNIVYALSDTIYKSADGGATWEQKDAGVNSPTQDGFLAIDPLNPNTVYVSTSDLGVFKSTDGGNNWVAKNNGLGAVHGQDMDIRIDRTNPLILYAFSSSMGVFRSADGGENWVPINTGLAGGAMNVRGLNLDPITPSTLYRATGAGLYKSTNSGTSWQFMNPFGMTCGVNHVAIYRDNPQVISISSYNTDTRDRAVPCSGFYVSRNGGSSWDQVAASEKARTSRIIGTATPGALSVYVSTWGHFDDPLTGDRGVFRVRNGMLDSNHDNQARADAGLENVLVRTLEASPDSTRMLWAAGYGGLFKHRNLFLGQDFDHDAKGDILWRNTSSGDDFIWTMNGLRIIRAIPTDGVADQNWAVAGTGDFNGDGHTDLLWRNSTSGDNAIWLMTNGVVIDRAVVNNVPTDWNVAGMGDFDGDGNTDVLWRANDGRNAMWFMNGLNLNPTLIDSVPNTWAVAAVGDFNGDGKSDILWREATTGDNGVWLMSGAMSIARALVNNVPGTWSVVGVGDFDADRNFDVMWRDGSTGDNALWLMNGLTIKDGALINRVADANWVVVGTGDYNGDYRSDVLWRHSGSGANYIWTMNGLSLVTQCGAMGCATGDLPAVPNTSWNAIKK